MEHLAHMELPLSTLIEASPNGIILVNRRGIILCVNRYVENVFKYDRGEMLTKEISMLIPHHSRDMHQKMMDGYFENPSCRQMGLGNKLTGLSKHGRHIPLEIGLNHFKIDGEDVVLMSVINASQYVLNMEKAEKYYDYLSRSLKRIKSQNAIIKESQRLYKSIIDNIDDVYYRTDNEEKITMINKSALRYINVEDTDQLLGLHVPSVFYRDSEDRGRLLEALMKNGGHVYNYELKLRGLEDEDYTFLTNSHFVYNSKGSISGVEGIIRDVTERRKAEELIKQKNKKIADAHMDITRSLQYAQSIQQSLLGSKNSLKDFFSSFFLYFKPKEQVSGDFYYVNKLGSDLYFAVADCTGHGVPGAFMTVMGITHLNNILHEYDRMEPGKLLDLLREKIKNTFRDTGIESDSGMDIALCRYNTATSELTYAGAFRPLIIAREDELIEYKPTRNPVGAYPKEINFQTIQVDIKKGDKLYLFSDGFQDQFGGEKDRKYGMVQFRKLLKQVHHLPLAEQCHLMDSTFTTWKNGTDQIDDVTVLGVEL